jgi:hemolysin activation/secretion protein
VNVFLGYVHGQSDQISNNYDGTAGTVDWSKFIFDERGFYLGASYSHQFGSKGTLSTSLAVGNMDGKMVLSTTNFGGEYDVLTSKSPGYSLSINWTGPLTGNLVYRTGFKVTKYTFSFDTLYVNGGYVPIPSDYYQLEETIYTFMIGIANYF